MTTEEAIAAGRREAFDFAIKTVEDARSAVEKGADPAWMMTHVLDEIAALLVIEAASG